MIPKFYYEVTIKFVTEEQVSRGELNALASKDLYIVSQDYRVVGVTYSETKLI